MIAWKRIFYKNREDIMLWISSGRMVVETFGLIGIEVILIKAIESTIN